jgi:hypothetical protein
MIGSHTSAIFHTILCAGHSNAAASRNQSGPASVERAGFALVGLVEVVSGAPVSKVASAWDASAGWQRGVLGILVVALAFILMMIGVVLFA